MDFFTVLTDTELKGHIATIPVILAWSEARPLIEEEIQALRRAQRAQIELLSRRRDRHEAGRAFEEDLPLPSPLLREAPIGREKPWGQSREELSELLGGRALLAELVEEAARDAAREVMGGLVMQSAQEVLEKLEAEARELTESPSN